MIQPQERYCTPIIVSQFRELGFDVPDKLTHQLACDLIWENYGDHIYVNPVYNTGDEPNETVLEWLNGFKMVSKTSRNEVVGSGFPSKEESYNRVIHSVLRDIIISKK